MRLLLVAPHIARRDCELCQKYVWNEKTGRAVEHPRASAQLLARPAGNQPPCRMAGVGCPKGTPEQSRAFTPANALAWQHYRECRAVGRFPEDAIVRRNAAIIWDAEFSVFGFQ